MESKEKIYQVKVIYYYKSNMRPDAKTGAILYLFAESGEEAVKEAESYMEKNGHEITSVTSVREIEVVNAQKKASAAC